MTARHARPSRWRRLLTRADQAVAAALADRAAETTTPAMVVHEPDELDVAYARFVARCQEAMNADAIAALEEDLDPKPLRMLMPHPDDEQIARQIGVLP